jgi:hypothetical protein
MTCIVSGRDRSERTARRRTYEKQIAHAYVLGRQCGIRRSTDFRWSRIRSARAGSCLRAATRSRRRALCSRSAWTRIRLGRRILAAHRRTLELACGILGSAPIRAFNMGSPALRRWPLLRRILAPLTVASGRTLVLSSWSGRFLRELRVRLRPTVRPHYSWRCADKDIGASSA